MITIFVNYSRKNFKFKLNEYHSIYSLKREISKKINIEDNNFYIKWNTKIIQDNQTLKYYGLKNYDTLQIFEKQYGGKTLSKTIMIILAVLLSFFLFFIILFGAFPILSYMLSAFIKSIFKRLGKFINSISNVNQILSKFIKTRFFKFTSGFFSKLIDFFSLTIYTYVITFGCTYFAFNVRAKNNFCKGFSNNKKLAKIVTISFIVQYFIFNFPIYIIKLIELISFGRIFKIILDPIFISIRKLVNIFRRLFLLFIPFLGVILDGYLGITIIALQGFKVFQKINTGILFKMCDVIDLIMNNPVSEVALSDFKLEKVIDLMKYVKNCDGQRNVATLDKSMIRGAYIVNWIYENIFYFLFLVGRVLNKTCPSNEYKQAESDIDNTKSKISGLIREIGAKKINPNTTKGKQITEEINQYTNILKKQLTAMDVIKKEETINPLCIQEMFTGGVFAAPLTFLIWLIAYIILIIKT